MPNPTRAQVEAYLATLPPDQQGPALTEIKHRMASVPSAGPQSSSADADFWGRAATTDPRTSAGASMTGADVRRGALTAAGLGAAFAVPAAVGAAVPAAAAYPGAMAALGGGTAAAIEGAGPKGVLFGALTGGALTKVGKLWKVAKMLGLVGKPAAAPAGQAGALTQAEMQNVVKQIARGEEGAVVNPAVEEVAAKMVPRGELPPLPQSEMLAILRGASPRATPVSQVGKSMVPVGKLPPMTQGEMTTVARGVGKPPAGWIENPSPETVAKFMQPAVPSGVDPAAVAALQKWGMSFDDAVRLATKATPTTAAAAAPVVAPAMPATPAIPLSSPATSVYTSLMEKPGAKQFEELLAQTLKEGRAKAALRAASRGQRQLADALGGVADDDALKLLAQGEGVIAP